MITWSTKRKILYASIIFVVFFLILFGLYFLLTYEAPNCSDGLKNQDELEVDCGGSCANLCQSQAKSPTVLWSKAFQITPGFYNVAALIENPNINAVTDSISYVFKLKDSRGQVVAERENHTAIPNSRIVVVFEAGFELPEVFSVDFEFLGVPEWHRDDIKAPEIDIKKKVLTREDTSPRLEVSLENRSARNISKLEVAALVFDENGEALGVSRTFVDDFYVNLIEDLVFTWPTPFATTTATIDIITREIP